MKKTDEIKMKRSVEFHLKRGKIEELAQESDDPKSPNYGLIEIAGLAGFANSPNDDKLIILTHYDYSFRKVDGVVQQPPVGSEIYCFVVPMEYLFSDCPGVPDSTPMMAINVTTVIPNLKPTVNNPHTRHPCTTVSTIPPDYFNETPPAQLLFIPFLLIPLWIINFFRRNKLYYYGCNDYGELTMIVTRRNVDPRLQPWDKVVLHDPHRIAGHEIFHRRYSPKRERRNGNEFKILRQRFHKMDPDWKWNQ